ncbi:MAG TPA: hypothetical protein ENK75_04620 [Saprospiraceae bacterium]|nr:hypothetical protein [Saprospiraceae bacterium]
MFLSFFSFSPDGSNSREFACGDYVFLPSSGSVFNPDSVIINDGSGEADYANNQHCESVVFTGDPSHIHVFLFKEFDLAEGDTLRIYIGRQLCGEWYLEFTKENPPLLDTWQYEYNESQYVFEFITDSVGTAGGWEILTLMVGWADQFWMSADVHTESGDDLFALVEMYNGGDMISCYSSNCMLYWQYFPALYEGIVVKAFNNSDHRRGITTLDIIILKKHILGLQPITSPYKLIAADVNNSGDLSVLDIIEMRKLILGITDTFANNQSWRFLNDCYELDVDGDLYGNIVDSVICTGFFPEPFPWFTGVKVGDLNESATN